MSLTDIQNLAKNLLSEGRIIKANIVVGYKPAEYFNHNSKLYKTYIVAHNNQLFWITEVDGDITSIYDLLAEKEVTAL